MIEGVPVSTVDAGTDVLVRAVDLAWGLVTVGADGKVAPISGNVPAGCLLLLTATSEDPFRLAALTAKGRLVISGSLFEIAYAVLHCAVGDLMIASVCLLVSLAAVGPDTWPITRFGAVAAATVLLVLCYTVFSEHRGRGSWTYTEAMPRLPVLGTGLTPCAAVDRGPGPGIPVGKGAGSQAVGLETT